MKKTTFIAAILTVLWTGCAPQAKEDPNMQTCVYEELAYVCGIDEICFKGKCLTSTNEACGISQVACNAYETCRDGVCVCKADDQVCSNLCCQSGCIDPKWSHDHCGGCGLACKTGQACIQSECSSVCPENLASCESETELVCVDISSNWKHCGGCFQSCPSPKPELHFIFSDCIRGKCIPSCEYGWEDANDDIADGCESPAPGKCGNGIIEPDELCDGTRLNDMTCASVLGEGSTGLLRCMPDCLSLSTSACTVSDNCGNGQIDKGETCDTHNLGGQTCASVVGPGSTGQLKCSDNCHTLILDGCTPADSCGDGIVDENEVCDGNILPGMTCATYVGFGSIGMIQCASHCAGYDISSCTTPSICGNGTREAGEACDGEDFGTATCASIIGGGSMGQLHCTANCSIESHMCSAPSTCGNGIAEGNDVCDGQDLKGKTCESVVGMGSVGQLKCAANCANFDVSECTAPASCGNDLVDRIEMCDGSKLDDQTCQSVVGKGSTGTLTCKPNCMGFDTSECSTPSQCGNGKIDAGEVCDGKALNSQSCADLVGPGSVGNVSCAANCRYFNLSGCSAPTLCGNDEIDKEAGEVCDGKKLDNQTCSTVLGVNAEGTLKCGNGCMYYDISDCTPLAYCGNGLIEPDEVCDLNNLAGRTCATAVGTGSVGTLRCGNTCQTLDTTGCSQPQTCGNGSLEAHEVCDSSLLNGQTCEMQVGPGSEGTPHCNETCSGYDNGTCTAATTCGDGELHPGEDCDGKAYKNKVTTCAQYAPSVYQSGNLQCSQTCSIDTSACVKWATATCGNGIIEPGEACDGTTFGAKTCQTELGMKDATGKLMCSNDCQSILTDQCEFCGDGKIDADVTEDCDGSEWMASSCVDYDPKVYSGGVLRCHAATCQFDLSQCTRIDASRECDESETRCTAQGLELCESGKWTVYDSCDDNNFYCSMTAEQCLPSAWCNIQHVSKDANSTIVGFSRILKGSTWLAENLDDMLVAMICTDDLSLPVNRWPYTAMAIPNESCNNCGENMEFMTTEDPITLPAGTHYCTFMYLFPDDKSYVCLPNKHGISEPIPVYTNTTKLSETTSYIVY